MKRIILVAVLVLSLAPLSAFGFAGMLSTNTGGLTGASAWATNVKMSWNITQQTSNNAWFYKYWLTDMQGNPLVKAVSHLTLEISPNVPHANFWGFNGSHIEFGNMSGITNAMKMDYGSTLYSFYSWQAPVWGDFYAKDGKTGGITNEVRNSGFYNADPTAPPADGSIGNKILRPDTHTSVVPEPATMLLFGLGMVGAGVVRRYRSN